MTKEQREKIEAAAKKYQEENDTPYICDFIAGAEFALKMVEEELKNSIDEVCDSVECVCHETNSRNCPVHQNWSRESEGSGV